MQKLGSKNSRKSQSSGDYVVSAAKIAMSIVKKCVPSHGCPLNFELSKNLEYADAEHDA